VAAVLNWPWLGFFRASQWAASKNPKSINLMICTSRNLKSNRSHGARNLMVICLPLTRESGIANFRGALMR
jgi:hypothetical protein